MSVVYVNHHLQGLTTRPERRVAKRPSSSLRERLARITRSTGAAARATTGTEGSVAPAAR